MGYSAFLNTSDGSRTVNAYDKEVLVRSGKEFQEDGRVDRQVTK